MFKIIAITALLFSLFGCDNNDAPASPTAQQIKPVPGSFYDRGTKRVRTIEEINAERKAEKAKEQGK